MVTLALSNTDVRENTGSLQVLTLTSFLSGDCIGADLQANSKAEILAQLAQILVDAHPELDQASMLRILEAREELSSTGLEHGVAIPHGKLPGLKTVIACFGRSREGLDFAALDGHPTHLFFLLMAPQDSTSEHLRALARIARLMKDAALRQNLLDADGPEELFALLREADAAL